MVDVLAIVVSALAVLSLNASGQKGPSPAQIHRRIKTRRGLLQLYYAIIYSYCIKQPLSCEEQHAKLYLPYNAY